MRKSFPLSLLAGLILSLPVAASAEEADPIAFLNGIYDAQLSTNAALMAANTIEFSPGVAGLQLGLGVGFETESGEPGVAAGAAIGLGQHVMLTGKAAATSGAGPGSHEFLFGVGLTVVLGGK